MTVEMNDLESRRFGIAAARVTDPEAGPQAVAAALSEAGAEFATLRLSTDALSLVQDYEAAGWRLMDTLVYYDRGLEDLPAPDRRDDGVSIRAGRPEDAPAVAEVAARAFAGYFGHYHADRRLDAAAADAVYVDWARRSFEACGPGAPTLVAEDKEGLLGFSTIRLVSDAKGEIVLNGVDPRAQRRGVYGRTIDHCMATLREAGRSQVVVSTQVNNIAVQRAWGRRGFRMLHSLYTMHAWL